MTPLSRCRQLTTFVMGITIDHPRHNVSSFVSNLRGSHVHLLNLLVLNLPDSCERVGLCFHVGETESTAHTLALLEGMEWDAMALHLKTLPRLQTLACRTTLSGTPSSRVLASILPCLVHHAFSVVPCFQGENYQLSDDFADAIFD